MDSEFLMKDELLKTNFCFTRQELLNNENNKFNYNLKYYCFDCNIGSFCCVATRENILKIIEIAKKYNLENIFLNKNFNKNSLLHFKKNSIDEIRKQSDIPDDVPVIFYFYRAYNYVLANLQCVKDYLEL